VGLGETSISGRIERDAILLWTVPKDWELKDAVTVPYNYAQVNDAILRVPRYCIISIISMQILHSF
jgi:hypothetical protein